MHATTLFIFFSILVTNGSKSQATTRPIKTGEITYSTTDSSIAEVSTNEKINKAAIVRIKKVGKVDLIASYNNGEIVAKEQLIIHSSTLDIYEKSILAKTIVLKWWAVQTQDVIAFQPHLSSKSFKQLQESQSLKQKLEYKGALQEDISESITAYQLNNFSKLPFFGGA